MADKTHSPDCSVNGGPEYCEGNLIHLAGYAECLLWKTKAYPQWVLPAERNRAMRYLYCITEILKLRPPTRTHR